MKRTPVTIRLSRGDVQAIKIVRERGRTRLLIYQDIDPLPLIQALLSDEERDVLTRALLRSSRPGGAPVCK